MKRNIRQTLLAPAALLLAVALGLAGCTNDDDFGRLPQGSVPLVLGDVTVAGMKPGTRAAGENASTRAAISENAAGYTGIRKSTFVNGDELALIVSNDGGTTNISVTATLTGGAWVLSEKAYVIPGTTTIQATHAGTEVTTGIKPDALEAATYTLTGQKVTLDLKHANAMIDITLPAGTLPAGVTLTSISLAAHNGIADETLTTVVEEEADGNQHYRAIALAGTTATPGTVKSITAVMGGRSYVATLATPLTVEANKKYPISLTFKDSKLSATVGTASTNWGAGATINVAPAGYTRIIDSPEALAQFAKDVNDDAAATGARRAVALQTADIDLSQLKPAADAGINPLTGTAYTYTATADNWVPIGSNVFYGKYNGNGHTISNLKGSHGLFGKISSAPLTGIHLRNVELTGVTGTVGCLVDYSYDNRVTLCSATGSITVATTAADLKIRGLIGHICGGTSEIDITRCSADVDINATAATGAGFVGGFAGYYELGNSIAGCMAAGDVAGSGNLYNGGFMGKNNDGTIIGCMATGNVTGVKSGAFVGSAVHIGSGVYSCTCYATGNVNGSANGPFVYERGVYDTYTDCAYTGTQATTITGITGGVATADLYATLTASNASDDNVQTLHWSAADGYTLTGLSNTWYATDVWKDNGTSAPTIDLAYEGRPLYNGYKPNLLAIPGKAAYYVAPKDAKNASGSVTMTWDEAMAASVCPEGWHVPTKDDFIAMGADDDYMTGSNNTALVNVFPSTRYWLSSTISTSKAWCIHIMDDSFIFLDVDKTSQYEVRCVRKK